MPLKNDINLNFHWVGSARDSDNGLKYYCSCSKNGEIFSVQNDVAIQGEHGKSYFCKILSLYEDPFSEEPYRADVCWYFEYSELPRKCKNTIKKSFVHEKELFQAIPEKDGTYYAGVMEEIDAETIKSVASIQKVDVDDKPPLMSDKTMYFVRYGFKKTGELCLIEKEKARKSTDMCLVVDDKNKKQSSKKKVEKVSKWKRKASRSIPDGGGEIVVSKKNKNEEIRRDIVSPRGKLFDSEEALGQLLNESDNEVFERSSDEESSVGIGEKPEVFDKNNNKKKNELVVSLRRLTADKQLQSSEFKTTQLQREGRRSLRSSNHTPGRKTQMDVLLCIPENNARDCHGKSVDNSCKPKGSLSKDYDNDDDADVEYNPCGSESESFSSEDERLSEDIFESEEDDEVIINRKVLDTPRGRRRSKPAKSGSAIKKLGDTKAKLKTPSRIPRSNKKIMTPSISDRAIPCATPKTPLQQARQRLHVSSIPDSLPCREEEFAEIYAFIEGKLDSEIGGCMYISGVPGTGKTATVHEVISVLESEREQGAVPNFLFIEVNGMKLTQPNQAYSAFLKALTGQKASTEHAASILEKIFSDKGSKRDHIILLVDELDLLWTRKQNVMYNLFEWPTRKHAKLIVVAVANTMDLPERVMMNRVSSRLGLTRMTFQPYTFRQLQEIVFTRIKGIEAFEEDAMELIARKVAAVSGDARRCLDICRRAVEISESQSAIGSPRKRTKGIVGMRHVNEALHEMFSSPKIIALRNLSKFEGFFMRSVVSEFRRSGLEEAYFKDVYDQFQDLCRLEDVAPPNASEAFQISSMLGSCKLLLTEPGYNDIYQRIRLNVSQDDVLFAMKERQGKTV